MSQLHVVNIQKTENANDNAYCDDADAKLKYRIGYHNPPMLSTAARYA